MRRILIVEDEPDIQELLRAYLRDAGYETAVAGDGVTALALFQSQPFDLVLLDIMLPRMDGFGVCQLLRQQSQVPILMLTALDGEEEQLRGFGMDIDDYITKVSPWQLSPTAAGGIFSRCVQSLWKPVPEKFSPREIHNSMLYFGVVIADETYFNRGR